MHTIRKTSYQCNLSDKAFLRNSDLISHIKIHTGEKIHQCNLCDKCFINESGLICHMKTNNNEKTY